ncbi:hypothetical protein MAFF301069_19780 [Ralstonia pseudosolanacearum]|nr:hypothetical protein MAFF211479_21140 [Ralstonia solanacearum]BEU51887.1 hypothetical protein MAFF211520_21790 [Ralstonia pseudosolanacearum]BCL97207.1 hypothetical protein MAFF211491_16590 [Ralstonia solanacearum]BCM12581.1 hypothetical protein MAFF241648_17710 [Ralstonia solanacearum]BCN04979.1 hypothetical protein RPSB_21160 [Ralstonia solanacearum]
MRGRITWIPGMTAGEYKIRSGRNTQPGRLSVKIPAAIRQCLPAPAEGTRARGARATTGRRAGIAPMRTARPANRRVASPAAPGTDSLAPAPCRRFGKTGMAPRSTGTNSKV